METHDLDWIIHHDKNFRYMLLSRLQRDCDYYLGYGNRNIKHLWAVNEQKHIEAMKFIWINFSDNDKPEWLSWEQIKKYESAMIT